MNTQEVVQINMLGEFTINYKQERITSGEISSQICTLISYLLMHKNSTAENLIDTLWQEGVQNPSSALKNLVYRTRKTLEEYGFTYAKSLIISGTNGYKINPEINIVLDVNLMEKFFEQAATEEEADKKIKALFSGVEMYKGGFLSTLTHSDWAVPVEQHYNTLYFKNVYELLNLYKEQNNIQNLLKVARMAVSVDKYEETAHKYIMYGLYKSGEEAKALSYYSYVTEIFYNGLGVELSPSTKQLYEEISKQSKLEAVEIGGFISDLKDMEIGGALFCDSAVFKQIYNFAARTSVRAGTSSFVGLLTLENEYASKRTKEEAVEHLGEAIKRSLRKGDAYTYCSPTQYAVILTMINVENTEMVMDRITKTFKKLCKNRKITLTYNIHPIEAPYWE